MNRYAVCSFLAVVASVSFEAKADLEASNGIECKHFWIRGAERIVSEKEVGFDVGKSPYGSDGVYECRLFISQTDVLEGRVVFLGEVGDASYLQPVSGPNGAHVSLPVYHGLSAKTNDSARYLRFVPFIVSLRDIYQADGWHRFDLHYRDLVPLQSGIRSGPPSIETWQGAIRRALVNAPGLSYHLVQIIVFLVIAAGVLAWRGVSLMNRLRLVASALASASIVFSITSLPRFFLDSPDLSIQLNDVINLLGFSLVFLPLVGSVNHPSGRFQWAAAFVVAFAALVSVIYWFLPAGGLFGFRFYVANLLLIASIYPFALFWMWRTGSLRPIVRSPLTGAQPSNWPLLIFSALMFWDVGINALILNIHFQFFVTHFFYLLPAVLWQLRLQAKETDAQRVLPAQLESIKNASLRKIATDPIKAQVLSEVCQGYAELTGASRVSIVEIVEDQIKFLGVHGAYDKVDGLQPLKPDSLIKVAELTGSPQSGVTAIRAVPMNGQLAKKSWSSEFYVLPLRHQGRLRGALCLTNFDNGYLSAFMSKRLASLQNEAEILFSLLLLERDNKAQANLLQMARLRVHAMQLKSEKYFLDNISVSDRFQQPAFIVGDLVDSTPLNKVYGAQKTRAVINLFLEQLFERFKQLGIILSSRNGDEISIVVPNQGGDEGPEGAAARAYEIIEYLAWETDLATIAKANGIATPFQFKFAASQAENKNSGEALPSAIGLLSTVTDSEIDSAYRVMSSVALPGECIILPRLAGEMRKYTDLIEISRDRLKGITNTLSLFSLSRNVGRRTALAKS